MNVEDRKYCVYAIQSETTGRLYIGQTDLLQRRIAEHNKGRVKSTKHEIPWKLVAIEYFEKRSYARWAETRFKKSKGSRLAWLAKNKV
jgi:putative endonuclease